MANHRALLIGVSAFAVILLGVALLLRTGPQIQVLSGPDAQPHVIAVSGRGKLDVKPDTAIVTLGFQKQAETAQEAQSLANAAMSAVLQAVKGKGVADEKIRTSSFHLTPEYNYIEHTGPVLTGYRVNSTVTITIHSLESTGPVIDAAIQAGANQVQNVQFTLKDQDQYMQEVIDKALANARSKAEKSAATLGTKVVGVRRVTVSEPYGGNPPIVMGRALEANMADMGMPIQPGEMQLNASVQVEFMLDSR